jgi:hypothetical protein
MIPLRQGTPRTDQRGWCVSKDHFFPSPHMNMDELMINDDICQVHTITYQLYWVHKTGVLPGRSTDHDRNNDVRTPLYYRCWVNGTDRELSHSSNQIRLCLLNVEVLSRFSVKTYFCVHIGQVHSHRHYSAYPRATITMATVGPRSLPM